MSKDEMQIDALIRLIEDPDDQIYEQVKQEILNIGKPIVPHLENAWEFSKHGIDFRNRVEDLLHNIHFESVQEELSEWLSREEPDLLDGALIICKYRYSGLDINSVKARIAAIRQDVWLELSDGLTPFEQVRKFNQVLFEKHGLKGDRDDYLAPRNSFINEVLEQKQGNPLSLSIIYQVIAEQLSIPIRGVNLPKHFILAYLDTTEPSNKQSRPRFYINPFSGGDVLTEKEIDEFLARTKIPKDSSFYLPCDTIAMVQRALNNLKHAYNRAEDAERSHEIDALIRLFP